MGVLSYGSSRSCGLQSCFLGILLLLWEDAKASCLGKERLHGEREKPSREPVLTSSRMNEVILDHTISAELPANNCHLSKSR